jgi:hypothetical protein
MMLAGFIWLRMGLMADFCKHGNKPSLSIKYRVFLDLMSDY